MEQTKKMDEKFIQKEEHKNRHKHLHCCLDELIADFFSHNKGSGLKTTLIELITWSHNQTLNPIEIEGE